LDDEFDDEEVLEFIVEVLLDVGVASSCPG